MENEKLRNRIALLEKAFRHYFWTKDKDGLCGRCGLGIQDPIHEFSNIKAEEPK